MGLLHFQHLPAHHISSVHSWWQISIKLIWIALEVKLPQSSLPLRIWNPCQLLHHMPVIAGHISESAADDSWRESVINNCSADCVSQLHNSWVDPDKSTPAQWAVLTKVLFQRWLCLCYVFMFCDEHQQPFIWRASLVLVYRKAAQMHDSDQYLYQALEEPLDFWSSNMVSLE